MGALSALFLKKPIVINLSIGRINQELMYFYECAKYLKKFEKYWFTNVKSGYHNIRCTFQNNYYSLSYISGKFGELEFLL